MSKLFTLANKLSKVTVLEQEQAMAAIVKKHEAEIVDLNIKQLDEGVYTDGQAIEPEYTPLTKEIKKGKGQPFNRVTLEDEGDFKRGMHLEGDTFPFEVNSTDLKIGKLDEKYNGEKFFGLSEENKTVVAQTIVKDDIVEYYKGLLDV